MMKQALEFRSGDARRMVAPQPFRRSKAFSILEGV